jgi:hypothetical protein
MTNYIEFGGRVDSPAPFLTKGGKLRALALKTTAGKLDAIVKKTLNDPACGTVEYRALGDHVLLMLGGFDTVSCTRAPFDTWGTVREVVASFFVPIVGGNEVLGGFLAKTFGLTGPYVIVDNPMSYVGGRDVYGYAKSQGRFTPAGGFADKVTVRVYGGAFDPKTQAGWRDFLEVEALAPAPPPDPAALLNGPAAVVGHFLPGFASSIATDSDLPYGGVSLVLPLLKSLANGKGSQIFLKQFRDAADGTKACYQAVVEGPVTTHKMKVQPSGRDFRVTLHQLDSHPIGDELGLVTQVVSGAYDIETDFTVENGVEVAP